MRIAFVYNSRKNNSQIFDCDAEAEFDSPGTIRGIKKSLIKLGHKVYPIEADENCYLKLKNLKKKIDLVFNIAEGFRGEAREAHIPSMLEMLAIPFTGSGPLGLALTLDKTKTKEILIANKIPTPKFQLLKTGKEKLNLNLKFPLIIKPNSEGSSKGITNDSVVYGEKEFNERAVKMIGKYHQPVLVEEFLEGEEYSVGLLGDGEAVEVLPIMRMNFSALPKEINKYNIDSYEAKQILLPAEFIQCPAKISSALESKLKNIAIITFRVLNCHDLARIDMRCDKKGNPYVLEVNALPAIDPDLKVLSGYPLAAKAAGMSYEEMLERIIKSTLDRFRAVNPAREGGALDPAPSLESKKLISHPNRLRGQGLLTG